MKSSSPTVPLHAATGSVVGSGDSAAAALFVRKPRRILVLYVGGTIGMMKNRSGALEPRAGYLTGEMHKMHELRESRDIAPFDIVEYEQLLDSSDMNATDYVRIAADVRRHYDDHDGFLIAHGTDTMHYTASALSFLLYNLAKPVIVTGAMVPLAEPYTDARRNIIISMMIASSPKICEVCIFFNDRLFRGNRCDKVYHTYGAFQSLNYPALGVMEAAEFLLKERYLLPQPTGAMAILSDLKGTVAVFDLQPDPDIDTIIGVLEAKKTAPRRRQEAWPRRVLSDAGDVEVGSDSGSGSGGPAATATAANNSNSDSNSPPSPLSSPTPAATSAAVEAGLEQRPLLDGVLLFMRGVGSTDSVSAAMLRHIAGVAARHEIVVVVTQREGEGTLSDSELARLHAIAPSLVYTGDMTAAAAEMKLMYLFGKGMRPAEVAAMMTRNLRGEITPPTVGSNL